MEVETLRVFFEIVWRVIQEKENLFISGVFLAVVLFLVGMYCVYKIVMEMINLTTRNTN